VASSATTSKRTIQREDVPFALGAGVVALALSTFLFVLYPAEPAVLALGVVLGSLSALVAVGLVLVWRANRIVNFAQGDLGGLAAVLSASLIVGRDWSFFPAVLVGLVTAAALGWALEALVIRRFRTAPRLQLTVATIGVAQLFQFGQLGLPQLFDYDTIPQPPTPFTFTFEWFPVTFRAGHVLILAVVPAVVVGLSWFLRRSRSGVAIRAVAESADRAALLGIPVQRVTTIVWTLAGTLSGLAVLLRMPIQGVAIGTPLGPSLLLRALAAAVIGRMENLPRTVVAALVLGVVEQAVFFQTGSTIVVDAVLFAVIIVALLAQRRGQEGRARDLGTSTWGSLREVRPIPAELVRLPEVRLASVAVGIAVVAALVLVPLGMTASQVNLFGVGLIVVLIMASLVILTGWAGQISLGHYAVVAFGASVAGSLALQGKQLFVCLAAAALTGAVVSVAIGLPALRIRGPFLAVTTLAFALATGTYFLNEQYFPWLVVEDAERVARPVLFNKFDLESEYAYYYLILVVVALGCASVRRLRLSRTGRALVANRDNTRAAQSFSIGPTATQLSAFALSGLLAGLAGGLYVFHQHGVSDTVLVPANNLKLFSVAVVGGLGSVPGALLGAGYLTFVDYSSFTREQLSRLLASGVGVLAILLVKPAGLGGAMYDLRDALLRRVARRRGIVVPSLLADVRVDADAGADATADGVAAVEPAGPPPTTEPVDPVLVVRDLEVSYGKSQVLFGVDLHVERGEILALLGTNGAGKSTLLSAVAGIVAPQRGTIVLDGVDRTGARPGDVVAAGAVLMPGGKGVFPTLTVAENLSLAGWNRQRDPELPTDLEAVLETFPVLRGRYHELAGNLSGGEQQMLTLGQALLARPTLLMIDELSLGLAPVVVEQLLGIVRRLHAAGVTIVLVEQSVNVAVTLAQRAVFLEKGEVRFDGPTEGLLARPDVLRSVFLAGATDGLPAEVRERRAFEASCDHCGAEHGVALRLEGVGARFGGVRAVADVDLAVRSGQVVGIIGPNGAGKTTLLDIISGFVPTGTGRIELEGADVSDLTPHARAALGLGRSFQDARLFPSMTVRQVVATACERHVAVREAPAALLLSPAVAASERAVAEEVDALIETLGLQAYADKFVGELSTGTRRIVDLACALAHRPSVLLLDEPSSGIAQRETEALGPVLLDIRDRTGAAIVVIEHDIPLVCSISDELVAMELGSVVARGTPDEVVNDPRVISGYLGTDEAVVHRSGSSEVRATGAVKAPRRRRAPLVASR